MKKTLLTMGIVGTMAFPAISAPRSPLPETAFDAGVLSAETLGRGGTIMMGTGLPSDGVENPAALMSKQPPSFYATGLVGESSNLPKETVRDTNALGGKVLQFMGVGGDQGVIFFQPVSRIDERQITDANNPTTDFRDVEYSANAFGFAGAAPWGRASFGLSLAYLWSAMSVIENVQGQSPTTRFTTGNGVRLNMGIRAPTGPVLWGLTVENAPAFIWGEHFRREMLPFKVRAGSAWSAGRNLALAAESETRFYREGGRSEDYIYLGAEARLSSSITIRSGVFGTDIGKSEERRVTGGLTYHARSGARMSYAIESYEVNNERIRRSFVSIQSPFSTFEGK